MVEVNASVVNSPCEWRQEGGAKGLALLHTCGARWIFGGGAEKKKKKHRREFKKEK